MSDGPWDCLSSSSPSSQDGKYTVDHLHGRGCEKRAQQSTSGGKPVDVWLNACVENIFHYIPNRALGERLPQQHHPQRPDIRLRTV
ncbi:hypothetical protein RvY_10264 [Ramazzottius varieornatus]|uniref:Uncharacterized protein n=1 Tax=Ramazzottius varieornatus TaxID=947166 RepID=A0A1D1VGQ0_RAMVA|nr:hypothetical protein RvY_10264 [Ramazzottius varieornatus]